MIDYRKRHPEYAAPDGKIWQCGACGKRAKHLFGGKGSDRGWDESCAMSCVLVDDSGDERDD